ncbi:hypothetical protein ACFQE7_42315 [Nonomuraea ferruginea]|uniref:hypothetical protein n=1 Tax=Nonomuraea ferruginea TaxID=46174 RepID=UPI003617F8BC
MRPRQAGLWRSSPCPGCRSGSPPESWYGSAYARRWPGTTPPSHHFRGLVKPTDAETELNGYRMRTARRLDWERQADAAEAAFARNGFLLLVGDRQIEDLDEEIALTTDPVVSFVKLVPLVGG